MTAQQSRVLAILERWYNEMWGRPDPSILPELVAETYLRHDVTGANNRVTPAEYQAMVTHAVGHEDVRDFSYFLVADGDFVAALGRYVLKEGRQWDWVQLFRVGPNGLSETWLPGMGGYEPLAVPNPDFAWTKGTIPGPHHDETDPTKQEGSDWYERRITKQVVSHWYERLMTGSEVTSLLAPEVRWHDMIEADAVLSGQDLQKRMRDLMQNDQATDLDLHLVQSGDFVVATGMWQLGKDQREWNWVQAFRIENGLIAESWLTSIGGTDTSIKHLPQTRWTIDVMPAESTRFGSEV